MDFANKADMTTTEFCTSGSPSEDLMHPIECDPSQGSINQYFVSTLNLSQGSSSTTINSQDLRFLNLGNFYIATTGFQGTKVNIGELWVTYQVTLLKPKLYSSLGLANDYFHMENAQGITTSHTDYGLLGLSAAGIANTQISSASNMPFSGISGKPYGSLWFISHSGNNRMDIHFPVYPFPTSYFIMFTMIFDAAVITYDDTWETSSGQYAHQYKPEFISSLSVPADSDPNFTKVKVWHWQVKVPGGFIPNLLDTPYMTFRLLNPPVVAYENYTWDLKISQISYMPSFYLYPFPPQP
jgi:hypothetical protein